MKVTEELRTWWRVGKPALLCMVGMLVGGGDVRANDNIPAGEQGKPLFFVGGTIHTVSGEEIKGGKLLVIDGKIDSVLRADGKVNLPAGTVTIDCAGKHLYPGMIAANSTLGLTEINAVRSTLDLSENGAINPNVRAQVSINPDSELIPVTRANGVLAALTIPQPGKGGLISGQSALIRLGGWTWEEMTVAAPVGMHVFWPRLRVSSKWTAAVDEKEIEKLRADYGKKIKSIERAFDDSRAYMKAKSEGGADLDIDLRWEAMIPVLEGKVRLFIHADTAEQIRSALHLAVKKEIGRPVIVGGIDAWRVAEELATAEASVILSEVNSLPLRRWEGYDSAFVAAGKLHEAGVSFCLANGGWSSNERNLPYQAGRAVAHGLPMGVAIKAVTLFPAEILGVSDRLGSLDEGKEATFFISDGNPLEVMTKVEAAYIQGSEIDLSSKHTRLYEKYQEKYRQLKREGEK